jgi:hypothetical protein
LLTAAPTREEAERIWREAAALVEFDVEPAEAQNS